MTQPPLGLMVAGTRSGCGKTTFTLALLAALTRRGLTVQACKIGPDFIDPTHHAALTGRPSYNLDSWMGGELGMQRVFSRMLRREPTPDLLLAEGVMGLFDGASGMGGPGSSAHAALLLGLPVLLIADARGMGQSVAAMVRGFVDCLDAPCIGVVCTHVGSPAHGDMLREAFTALGLPLLGLLPKEGLPSLSSRHLGLLLAHEAPLDAPRQEALALWLEAHLDVSALLQHLPRLDLCAAPPHRASSAKFPRLGVAFDQAFCFLYPDYINMLHELGVDCETFSPLYDVALPAGCAGLYFPGGYPELHGEKLAGNVSLRRAVQAFALAGGVVYGECGGYMYLMDSIAAGEQRWPMTGCLPLACRLETTRQALGYRSVTPCTTGIFGPEAPSPPVWGRGHEFHYARIVPRPDALSLPPLWQVRDRSDHALPDEGSVLGATAGSWVHLYPEGAHALWAHFAARLRRSLPQT